MLEPRYWDFQSRVLPFVLRPHLKLVVQAGFEPAYASVSDSCRNQAWRLDNLKSFGVGGGTRTHNQGIMIPWHHHCATPTLELEIALAAMCSVLRGRRFTSQPFQHLELTEALAASYSSLPWTPLTSQAHQHLKSLVLDKGFAPILLSEQSPELCAYAISPIQQ